MGARSKKSSQLKEFVDIFGVGLIAGWTARGESTEICINLDGVPLICGYPDVVREDVERAGLAPAKCGFELRFDKNIAEGKKKMDLRIGADIVASGAIEDLPYYEVAAPIRYHIDKWKNGFITGWASRNDNTPATVKVIQHGRTLVEMCAVYARPDVEQAGAGNLCSGFSIDLRQVIARANLHEPMALVIDNYIAGWKRCFVSSFFAGCSIDLVKNGMVAGRIDIAQEIEPRDVIVELLSESNPAINVRGFASRSIIGHYSNDSSLGGVGYVVQISSMLPDGMYGLWVSQEIKVAVINVKNEGWPGIYSQRIAYPVQCR